MSRHDDRISMLQMLDYGKKARALCANVGETRTPC
jgi:hypothetical protein